MEMIAIAQNSRTKDDGSWNDYGFWRDLYPCGDLYDFHKLELGNTFITSDAQQVMIECGLDVFEFIDDHAYGNHGDIDEAHRLVNNVAFWTPGTGCVLSVYRLAEQRCIVIKTESDRSKTTVSLSVDC